MQSKYAFNKQKMKTIYEEPWKLAFDAFQVFGNLYFVGNRNGASWLLDSGEGLILFDTNYPTMDTLLIDSIWSLGFNPRNIIAIFHTHGHFDHFGATDLIKALSGAKTYLGEKDAEMFETCPVHAHVQHSDYSYLTLFTPDVRIKDGDVFTFGNTCIRCRACPGHTPGAMSYFFPVTDGRRTLTAGLHGGAGLNTLCRAYIEEYGVNLRADFLESLHGAIDEKVDIFLGNHTKQNDTAGRRARMLAGEADAFVDENAWRAFHENLLAQFNTMLEEEALGKDMI